MTHHLAQGGLADSRQLEHRAGGLPHRRQLGWIAHEHQAGAEAVGAAQQQLQHGAVQHRGLIDQHQVQVFQGAGGLLAGLAELPIAAPLEVQP